MAPDVASAHAVGAGEAVDHPAHVVPSAVHRIVGAAKATVDPILGVEGVVHQVRPLVGDPAVPLRLAPEVLHRPVEFLNVRFDPERVVAPLLVGGSKVVDRAFGVGHVAGKGVAVGHHRRDVAPSAEAQAKPKTGVGPPPAVAMPIAEAEPLSGRARRRAQQDARRERH